MCYAAYGQQDARPRRATYYPSYNTNLVRDFSGKSNTATNSGASLYESNDGWVCGVDGTHLSANYQSVNFDVANNYSFFAKVKANESGTFYFLSKAVADNLSGYTFYFLDTTDDKIYHEQRGSSTVSRNVYYATNAINLGEWMDCCVVRSNGSTIFYYDGQKLQTVVVAENCDTFANSSNLWIGLDRDAGNARDITFDTVCIYSNYVSESDVVNMGNGIFKTNDAVMIYRMQPEYR